MTHLIPFQRQNFTSLSPIACTFHPSIHYPSTSLRKDLWKQESHTASTTGHFLQSISSEYLVWVSQISPMGRKLFLQTVSDHSWFTRRMRVPSSKKQLEEQKGFLRMGELTTLLSYKCTWGWDAASDHCVSTDSFYTSRAKPCFYKSLVWASSTLHEVKEGQGCLTFLNNRPNMHWVMLIFSQGLKQYSPFPPSGALGQSVFL